MALSDQQAETAEKSWKKQSQTEFCCCPICGSNIFDQFLAFPRTEEVRCRRCNWLVAPYQLVKDGDDVVWDY